MSSSLIANIASEGLGLILFKFLAAVDNTMSFLQSTDTSTILHPEENSSDASPCETSSSEADKFEMDGEMNLYMSLPFLQRTQILATPDLLTFYV